MADLKPCPVCGSDGEAVEANRPAVEGMIALLRDATEDHARAERAEAAYRELSEQTGAAIMRARSATGAREAELIRLRGVLRTLADPESWLGDPLDHSAVLLGHFTPYELAREALGDE